MGLTDIRQSCVALMGDTAKLPAGDVCVRHSSAFGWRPGQTEEMDNLEK